MNRLRAGYCKMVNPYNQRAIRVDLTRAGVDGIIFWAKNVGPFLGHLDEVAEMGHPFMIQYSINRYPRTVEFSVVDTQRSVGHMKLLRGRYGQRAGAAGGADDDPVRGGDGGSAERAGVCGGGSTVRVQPTDHGP